MATSSALRSLNSPSLDVQQMRCSCFWSSNKCKRNCHSVIALSIPGGGGEGRQGGQSWGLQAEGYPWLYCIEHHRESSFHSIPTDRLITHRLWLAPLQAALIQKHKSSAPGSWNSLHTNHPSHPALGTTQNKQTKGTNNAVKVLHSTLPWLSSIFSHSSHQLCFGHSLAFTC